jgi:hypothetical protein
MESPWDRSEVVVATVYESGEYEPFTMDGKTPVPEGARYIDTMTLSLEAAIGHAAALARKFSGVAYVATLLDFRRTDADDTWDPNNLETHYEIAFPFRTYVLVEVGCEGGAC